MPKKFALKELSSKKIFRPGVSGDIRDYLPLNEPSIQRFLKHNTIVQTYWADVRCLDPKTDEPLAITAYDLTVDADGETVRCWSTIVQFTAVCESAELIHVSISA